MRLKTKIKLMLAQTSGVKLSEFKSGDITFYILDGDELAEGVEIFVKDDEGAYIVPEDGTYPIDENNVTIEKGVITKIAPLSGEGGNGGENGGGTGELKTKLTKLADDAEVTVDDYNALVDVVNVIIEAVEEMGGEVEKTAEELKLSRVETATFRTEAAAAKSEAQSVKAELKLALQRSNGKFEKPNPSQKGENGKDADPLKKFGL